MPYTVTLLCASANGAAARLATAAAMSFFCIRVSFGNWFGRVAPARRNTEPARAKDRAGPCCGAHATLCKWGDYVRGASDRGPEAGRRVRA
ncbi:MAG: hypothetical protein OHK0026_01870 [Rhodocyclaceae bacterium]